MHTFAPALALIGALLWPAAAHAQSLGEVAQREAARRKAEASAPKTAAPQTPAAPAALPAQPEAQPDDQFSPSATGNISLADIARREAARRKALAASGQRARLLTNGDVKKWEPPADTASPDTTPVVGEAGKAADAAAGAGRPTDSSKDATDEAKGEEYWHSRVSAAREELRRNQAFAEALQSRINALSAEFSAKDDPAARALVADDRQKAIAELDRLTKQIADNQKAIADIEEDARRAGVPAGWIR
ncbi:MAG TPA: hypothetical protein VL484_12690 [Vicinamibacterales bacterium]|jgi:hypothetical protein|nr:hypothetical protein [Vicinamibacterales bacterium]